MMYCKSLGLPDAEKVDLLAEPQNMSNPIETRMQRFYLLVLVSGRKRRYSGDTWLTQQTDPVMASRRTSLSVIKGLLLQLLDGSVGDISLFGALCKAFEQSDEMLPSECEASLWSLLKEQLVSQTVPVLMIIDGLDQLDGDSTSIDRVRGRLCDIAKQRSDLRCIILVRPNTIQPCPGVFDYGMDMSLILKEVRHYLRDVTSRSTKLSQYLKHERDIILRRILERNIGSFLEAKMLIRILELENSYNSVLRTLGKIPSSLTGIIDYSITNLDFNQQDTVRLLSWLLCNERVFTAAELATVTGIQLQDIPSQATTLSLEHTSFCGAIVEIRLGKVQFVHPLVGQRLRELSADRKIPLKIKEAYKLITLQSIQYIRSRLPPDSEPAFRNLSSSSFSELYSRLYNDRLFSYCVTSYHDSFERSSLNDSGESRASCLIELKKELPDSPLLVLAEYAQLQISHDSIEQNLLKAFNLRKSVFGRRSRSAIQSLAALAHLQMKEKLNSLALSSLAEAWHLARDTYGDTNRVCRECAEVYRETFLGPGIRGSVRASSDAEKIFRSVFGVVKSSS